jgi:hypothetical protein
MIFDNLTQKELKELIREKINKIGICNSLKKYNKSEYDFFITLFKRHPEYPQKFVNMSDITIGKRFKCLEVFIIKNGVNESVSVLNRCVTKRPKNKLQISMRESIYSQIIYFKDNSPQICQQCGNKNNLEVDHDTPQFTELYNSFLKTQKVIPTSFQKTNNFSRFSDKFLPIDYEFETKWKKFHEKNAVLQILCKTCNQKKPKITR